MSFPNGEFPIFIFQSNSAIIQTPRTTTQEYRLRPVNRPNEQILHNSALEFITLPIPPNIDIIEYVENYAESNRVCVTILSGYGAVREVTLYPIVSEHSPTIIFENMRLVSFSGSFLFYRESTESFFSAVFVRRNSSIFGGMVSRMITTSHGGAECHKVHPVY